MIPLSAAAFGLTLTNSASRRRNAMAIAEANLSILTSLWVKKAV
jgi:hypothetical protein